MLKSSRETKLAGVFGLTILVFAVSSLWSDAADPTELQNEVSAEQLAQQITALKRDAALIDRSQSVLKTYAEKSLPGDPGKAAAAYQRWLASALTQCGIRRPTLTPAPGIAVEGCGTRIPMTAEFDTNARQFAQFMDAVSEANLLHRVVSLSVMNGSAGRTDELHVSISLEGLALAESPTETPAAHVPADGQLQSLVTDHNFFRPAPPKAAPGFRLTEVRPRKRDKTQKQATPPPDPLRSIQFFGTIGTDTGRKALFCDRNSPADSCVSVGENLLVGKIEYSVRSVERDYVVLRDKEAEVRVNLGDTLAAAIPNPTVQ